MPLNKTREYSELKAMIGQALVWNKARLIVLQEYCFKKHYDAWRAKNNLLRRDFDFIRAIILNPFKKIKLMLSNFV